MSIPFTPPSRQYIPLEDVVKLAPNLGYQLFFAHQNSTTVIEENVAINSYFRHAAHAHKH